MKTQYRNRSAVISGTERELLDKKYISKMQSMLDTIFIPNSTKSNFHSELEFGLFALARFLGNGGEPQRPSDSLNAQYPWVENAADDIHKYLSQESPVLLDQFRRVSTFLGKEEQFGIFHTLVSGSIVPANTYNSSEFALGVLNGTITSDLSRLSFKS